MSLKREVLGRMPYISGLYGKLDRIKAQRNLAQQQAGHAIADAEAMLKEKEAILKEKGEILKEKGDILKEKENIEQRCREQDRQIESLREVSRQTLSAILGLAGDGPNEATPELIDRVFKEAVTKFQNGPSERRPCPADPENLGMVALERTTQVVELFRQRVSRVPMLPFSAFVINYNESPFVEASLISLSGFAEVILCDKGSKDFDQARFAGLADHVIRAAWTPVVEDTRAMVDAACHHEWRLFLDADEMLTAGAYAVLGDVFANYDSSAHVVAFYRENLVFGEVAERNFYAHDYVARAYRKDALRHMPIAHAVDRPPETLTVPADSGARIIHFNQDNIFEYLQKANRYTETYTTRYPPPQNANEVFGFAYYQLMRAHQGNRARSGEVRDAVADLVTTLYFITEYVKQWERSRALDVDTTYADVMERELARTETILASVTTNAAAPPLA